MAGSNRGVIDGEVEEAKVAGLGENHRFIFFFGFLSIYLINN